MFCFGLVAVGIVHACFCRDPCRPCRVVAIDPGTGFARRRAPDRRA